MSHNGGHLVTGRSTAWAWASNKVAQNKCECPSIFCFLDAHRFYYHDTDSHSLLLHYSWLIAFHCVAWLFQVFSSQSTIRTFRNLGWGPPLNEHANHVNSSQAVRLVYGSFAQNCHFSQHNFFKTHACPEPNSEDNPRSTLCSWDCSHASNLRSVKRRSSP